MIDVRVEGNPRDVRSLLRRAPGPQSQYAFSIHPGQGHVRLNLVDREGPAPFAPATPDVVTVCTWQSRGISQYAGLWRGDYLLLLSIAGLTQLQALRRNPVLIAEDLGHGYPCGCLFERRPLWEDYALLLERPHVCGRCLRFYSALCADEDLRALRAVVAHAVQRHDPMSSCAGVIDPVPFAVGE